MINSSLNLENISSTGKTRRVLINVRNTNNYTEFYLLNKVTICLESGSRDIFMKLDVEYLRYEDIFLSNNTDNVATLKLFIKLFLALSFLCYKLRIILIKAICYLSLTK